MPTPRDCPDSAARSSWYVRDDHGMSDDFRATLYRGYVSTFKGEPDLGGEGAFVWWDHKCLPVLDELGRPTAMLEVGGRSGGLVVYLGRLGFAHARGGDMSDEQVHLAHRRGVAVAGAA